MHRRHLSNHPDRKAAAGDESGSGTAIGVAIIFPMLLLVIVTLQGITFATRTEQTLQAVADRAAHTAALCCLHVNEAIAMVEQSLALHVRVGPNRQLECANDVVGDVAVVFRDVTSAEVPAFDVSGNANIVPAGGQAAVRVRCQLPSGRVGAFGFMGSDVDRSAIGVATLDPGRHRSASATP